MSIISRNDPFVIRQVSALVRHEYLRAATPGEWHARLASLGYQVKPSASGAVLATLPHGHEICALPWLPRNGADPGNV